MKRLVLSTCFLLFTLAAIAQESDSSSFYLVIDGERATQSEFNKMQLDSTAVIHFLKADKAMDLFGPAARNGALIISGHTEIEDQKKAIYLYRNQRISADSIEFNNVSRIDVIRGRQALNLYGVAGKNGVYIIHDQKPQFTNVILRITDKNGKPVRNATIKNKNGSILAKSDKCGWVNLENFSIGNTVTIAAGKKYLSDLVVTQQILYVKL